MTEEGRKEKERGQEHTQWGEVGEGEAVCGVSVTCPGGVAWVECAAQCVGGWLGGGGGKMPSHESPVSTAVSSMTHRSPGLRQLLGRGNEQVSRGQGSSMRGPPRNIRCQAPPT